MNLKQAVIETATAMGFHQTVVASLEPMRDALVEYESWLASGHAASMDYLKRDPERRTSPALIFPGSRSVILLSVSYYSEPSLHSLQAEPGSSQNQLFYGKVARYAVGLDYHAVIRRKLRELKAALETELNISIQAKAFTDDVPLYEQALAARHGLGFVGKNSLIIGPKLSGSYSFVAELFVDLELPPDVAYEGTCGNCFRCGSACPTAAIRAAGVVDGNRCISFLTIENKAEIPLELREQVGEWVFGCDVCQEVCPYNQRPPLTPWPEFMPDRGAGHYLNLLEVVQLTEPEFKNRFEHTPLRRPKRRGLIRNALVVLGNQLSRQSRRDVHDSDAGDSARSAADTLAAFVETESDPLLREHAVWAISRDDRERSLKLARQLAFKEPDASAKTKMERYL